jgi:hypothetical protein
VSEMTFKQAEMRRDVARRNVLRAWGGETATKALPRQRPGTGGVPGQWPEFRLSGIGPRRAPWLGDTGTATQGV